MRVVEEGHLVGIVTLKIIRSGADHRQQHLEPGYRLQRVRLMCRHDDQVTRTQSIRPPSDRDRGFAVHDLDEGVVGRGVFAQLLPGVEGEQRDVAGLTLEDDPADDRSVLIRHQVPDATYLRLLVHG